eukprot:153595-Chlamydomonas_euryale.AAC.5
MHAHMHARMGSAHSRLHTCMHAQGARAHACKRSAHACMHKEHTSMHARGARRHAWKRSTRACMQGEHAGMHGKGACAHACKGSAHACMHKEHARMQGIRTLTTSAIDPMTSTKTCAADSIANAAPSSDTLLLAARIVLDSAIAVAICVSHSLKLLLPFMEPIRLDQVNGFMATAASARDDRTQT